MPEGESPLLLPMNEHKRLVVIDFEYANANVPGLEFANHFVRIAIVHSEDPSDKYRLNGVITTMILNDHMHAK
jgi:choline kinase